MYFPSKKDILSSIIFWIPLLLFISLYILVFDFKITSGNSIFTNVLYVLVIGLLLLPIWIWLRTGYKVNQGSIKIKSGPFRKKIRIEEIKTLKRKQASRITISPFSGPALSVDQLEILYGEHFDVIHISRKSKQEFIKQLVAKNPHIQIDKTLPSK